MELYVTFVHKQAKLGLDNHLKMVRWIKIMILHACQHGCEIIAQVGWGRERYQPVTDYPHNAVSVRVGGGGEKYCVYLNPGYRERGTNPRTGVTGGSAYKKAYSRTPHFPYNIPLAILFGAYKCGIQKMRVVDPITSMLDQRTRDADPMWVPSKHDFFHEILVYCLASVVDWRPTVN